jgi:hypothetical protein
LAQIRSHLRTLETLTESNSDDGRLIQFEYNGPVTGVYCLFDLSLARDHEQAESLSLPAGYQYADLSVSINYLRPTFFALEIMPVVSGIADALHLALYNPQADEFQEPRTGAQRLIQSWIEHNDKVTRGLARQQEPIRKPYLPRRQSLDWWKYTTARESLQNTLGEDVFVPSILFLVDGENHVRTTVIWSAETAGRLWWSKRLALPQVFPVCDYLMLASGRLGAGKLSTAIVPYAVAITALADLVEDLEGPVEGLKILWPQNQVAASKVFDTLPKQELGELKQISTDDFVDVETTWNEEPADSP